MGQEELQAERSIQKGDGGEERCFGGGIGREGYPQFLSNHGIYAVAALAACHTGLAGCWEAADEQTQARGGTAREQERGCQGRDRSGAHRAALLQSQDLPGLRTSLREGVGRAQPGPGF